MRLLLIRHGQTHSNVSGSLDTARPGADLTDLGREQAELLVERLKDEPVDALHASTLVRTQQTIAPLARARGLEVTVHDGIREWDAGDLEMNNDLESVDLYIKVAMSWAAGQTEVQMPGGPTGEQALGRFDAVIEQIAGSGAQCAAVVSHGAAIRTWVAARARQVDVDFAAEHPLLNTQVVRLVGDAQAGWEVEDWGW
ncbi:histidine phosphatase family protein [Kineosporia rhizophila]|uniref:histidine phosphatase family protein n=1 Tax=Kineosporia TaxID=49184 RepID=UPI001E57C1D7|nr:MULTISPECIES: histidine phosphatase family protein [Kineosporia]MCE0540835.1 histidine phosphatase family protein [Kineosporia rhizophila]GLY20229.1 isomerase [Kineosporia sp. NBRC 101677]